MAPVPTGWSDCIDFSGAHSSRRLLSSIDDSDFSGHWITNKAGTQNATSVGNTRSFPFPLPVAQAVLQAEVAAARAMVCELLFARQHAATFAEIATSTVRARTKTRAALSALPRPVHALMVLHSMPRVAACS